MHDKEFQLCGELKDWLASIRKGQHIYELFEKKTVYLAYNTAEEPVSEFIRGHLVRNEQLIWTELEGLLVGKYAK